MILISLAIGGIVILAAIGVALFYKTDETRVVYYTNVNSPLMESWLLVNESDAYITWEPFVSSSVVGGTGKVLMWSDEIMPNHPCCVVVVSKDFLSTELGPELTQRFIRAHIEATEWMISALDEKTGENYTKLIDMGVDYSARSAEVVEEALEHIKFGYEMNESYTDALEQFTQMYLDDGWITESTFSSHGYSNVTDFVDEYVDSSYLSAADDLDPSTEIINPDNPIMLGYLVGDLHELAQKVASNSTTFGGQSIFEKYGLNVVPSLESGYSAGGTEMDAFNLGEVDIGYLGAPPAIIKHINSNANTLIIAQANTEGSGLVVSADSDVNELEDLVSRVVATPHVTSIQHLLLKMALERIEIPLVKG